MAKKKVLVGLSLSKEASHARFTSEFCPTICDHMVVAVVFCPV